MAHSSLLFVCCPRTALSSSCLGLTAIFVSHWIYAGYLRAENRSRQCPSPVLLCSRHADNPTGYIPRCCRPFSSFVFPSASSASFSSLIKPLNLRSIPSCIGHNLHLRMDTGLPIPGDRAGGSITDCEGSVLPCSCQLSCITLQVLQVQMRHIGYLHHGWSSSG